MKIFIGTVIVGRKVVLLDAFKTKIEAECSIAETLLEKVIGEEPIGPPSVSETPEMGELLRMLESFHPPGIAPKSEDHKSVLTPHQLRMVLEDRKKMAYMAFRDENYSRTIELIEMALACNHPKKGKVIWDIVMTAFLD